MNSGHPFMGTGESCELLLEAPGYLPEYCGQTAMHPVHSGVCIHCAHTLVAAKGDLLDVCRFCRPNYGVNRGPEGNQPPRCLPCQEGSLH